MKILNLYSGIGGNRKLWEGVDVTAVETILLDALEEIKDLADDGRIIAIFFELDKAMSEIFTKAQKAITEYASSTKEDVIPLNSYQEAHDHFYNQLSEAEKEISYLKERIRQLSSAPESG